MKVSLLNPELAWNSTFFDEPVSNLSCMKITKKKYDNKLGTPMYLLPLLLCPGTVLLSVNEVALLLSLLAKSVSMSDIYLSGIFINKPDTV